MENKRYFLHGKLSATEGNGENLGEILLQAADLVSKAPGCHLYLISKDHIEKDSIWITEVWDDKAAHDESLNAPGVRELIGQAIPILAGQPQKGQELSILGGFGL